LAARNESLTADAPLVAALPSGRARPGRSFAVSLAVHGAAGLFALLFLHAAPMREQPVVTFEMLMPAAPTPASEPPDATPPASAGPAPVPEAVQATQPETALAPQPVATATPQSAAPVAVAPVPSLPVAAAAEPLPAPAPVPIAAASIPPPEAARTTSPRREPVQRAAVPARPAPSRPQAGPAAASAPPAEPAPSQPAAAPPAPPAHPSPAWLAGISAWLLAHRSYPDAARQRGQEGTVVVRFTVDHDGHVLDVTLVRGSGSDALDQAAQSLLRGAVLPPFPSEMTLPQQVITVPIRYRLEP